jgi:hypothetical protein
MPMFGAGFFVWAALMGAPVGRRRLKNTGNLNVFTRIIYKPGFAGIM